MAKRKWQSIRGVKGVQFVEETTQQRNGPRKDYYYRVHFQVEGKKYFIGIGRETEGWTLENVIQKRREYFENTKKGVKPRSPKEEIELAQEEARQEEEEKARLEEEKAKEERRNMRFSDFWEQHYFKNLDSRKSEKTWKQEAQLFRNYIKPAIGNLRLQEIGKPELNKIKEHMKGKSERNLGYTLQVVKQVFNFAIENDFYDYANPTKKIKIPSGVRERKGYLTREEEKELLPALAQRSQLMHDLALASLYTGMRFSELARLRWQDIDWERNQVTIYKAKDPQQSAKVRHASFPPTVRRMLEERKGKSGSDLVFPGKSGNVMNEVPDTFARVVEELGLNAGRDEEHKIVFYSLRHTFATRLLEKGVHQFTLAELMGHSSIKTTKKYSHADGEYQKAVNLLEEEKEGGKVLNGNFQ